MGIIFLLTQCNLNVSVIKYVKIGIIALLVSVFLFSFLNIGVNDLLIIKNIELAVAAIIAATVYLLSFKRPIQIPKFSIGFLVLALYVLTSSLTSKYSTNHLYFHLLLILLTYLVLVKIFDITLLKGLYIIFSVIGLFEATFGLLQLNNSALGLGLTGHFNNQVGFAATLVALIPFALFLINSKKKIIKIYGISTTLIMLIAIILSMSRAGILATSICIMCFTFKYLNFYTLKINVFIKIAITIIIISLISIAAYFLYKNKKDSANGRLLIWQCTINMINDKPILGYGTNSFNANYMLYQAKYFKSNQNKKFEMLADNVSSTYNEYLNIVSQYGIVGLSIFMILYTLLALNYFRNFSPTFLAPAVSILSIFIFAFFSYPFAFSIILILLTINTFIIAHNNGSYSLSSLFNKIIIFLIIGIFIYSLFMLTTRLYTKQTITNIRYSINHGNISKINTLLQSTYFIKNPYLLYNFAVILNEKQYYFQSINVLLNCRRQLNDYDVAILLADNYFKLLNYNKAEKWALLASEMCPNRFVPMYYLISIYANTNRLNMAIDLSIKAINKPVKIHADDVYKVKIFAHKFLNANHF